MYYSRCLWRKGNLLLTLSVRSAQKGPGSIAIFLTIRNGNSPQINLRLKKMMRFYPISFFFQTVSRIVFTPQNSARDCVSAESPITSNSLLLCLHNFLASISRAKPALSQWITSVKSRQKVVLVLLINSLYSLARIDTTDLNVSSAPGLNVILSTTIMPLHLFDYITNT